MGTLSFILEKGKGKGKLKKVNRSSASRDHLTDLNNNIYLDEYDWRWG